MCGIVFSTATDGAPREKKYSEVRVREYICYFSAVLCMCVRFSMNSKLCEKVMCEVRPADSK